MEAWIQDIFYWLPIGTTYYVLMFLIAFLESLALVGLLVPGSTLLLLAGFLAANGKGAYPPLVIASILGAVLGDLLSYWLGARMGASLLTRPIFRRYQKLFRKSELFFADHGGKSVFSGRFIGPLRPFIPFVAGYAQMAPLRFVGYTVIGGILWGLAYPGLGYFFGTSWHRVELWAGRFSYLPATVLGLLIVNQLFWKKLAPGLSRLVLCAWKRIATIWGAFLRTPLMRHAATRYPRFWRFMADRFSLHHGTGLYLTVGFTVVILFAALFINLVGPLTYFDHQVYRWMTRIQHPTGDIIALFFTCLGNGPVIAGLGLWVCLWLVLQNRYFSAAILVGGALGGELLVFLLKLFFARPRPEAYFPHLTTALQGFPSAHAFVALVFYGLLVYMLLNTLSHLQTRFYLVIGGSFLTLLIGFSRLYLGVHWFSDILGGYALAAAWLTILITACEMRLRYAGEFPWREQAPRRLSRRIRLLILTVTGILLFWIFYGYIGYRLSIDLMDKTSITTAKPKVTNQRHVYRQVEMG